MVNKIFYGLIIVILITSAIFGYFYFFKQNDQVIIKRNLEKLAQKASKSEESGGVSLYTSSHAVDKLIADKVILEVGYAEADATYSKYTFSNQILRAKTAFQYLKFTIYDSVVKLNPDKKSATVTFTIDANGRLKSGQVFNDVKDVVATVIKNNEGKWVFRKFSLQRVVYK
ncbi:hypothetical protein AAEX28_07570 [Lentisphaerota bacterium WC36G]|nr:hypothetical protein LJT99_10430 [Lentisphaerae bacterium WC36]